jgi:hypothetical protein
MKSILLSTLFFISITTFAQDSSFQLKDYQYRTPGFKALSIAANFSGSINSSKNVDLAQTKDQNFSLLPSQFNYSRFISTDKRVHTSYFTLSPSAQYYSTNNDSQNAKSSALQYAFAWDRSDRFYKNSKWFFEIGNYLSNSWEKLWHHNATLNDRLNYLQIEDKVSLGFGKGRVEMVQDAQMALYILNDLQQEGLLQVSVQPEVAGNFAKLITAMNNQRVFDSRRKRIYELTQIDSFLRNSGLLNETDIRHFTIINDNWALAYNPGRKSGSDWFIRVQPSAGFQKNTSNSSQQLNTSSSSQITKSFELTPMIGYEKFVPVNLKWQRNMIVSFSYHTVWNDADAKSNFNGTETKLNTSSHETESGFYASYGMGYFPNNRTAVNASLQLEASHIKFDNLSFKSATAIIPSISFSADYFISYKTRFSANWYLYYNKTFLNPAAGKQIETYNFNTNIAFGLSHIIF